ncbi:AI-2E family transporter [candidate division KSB1 bacterium]|nr:AI-2E family transporter [candidate division KSB1 bacterium]
MSMKNKRQERDSDTRVVLQESREKFSQIFLIFALLGLMILFGMMIKMFFVPIILAGVFCSLFFPLYKGILRMMKGRDNLSAFIMVMLLLILLLIPVTLVVNVVAQQAVSLYNSVEPTIKQLFSATSEDWAVLTNHPLISKLHLDTIDWEQTIQEGLKTIASSAGKIINVTSKGTFLLFTYTIITLFTMFYFFRDGERIIGQIMSLLPMDDEYKTNLIDRFVSISRATVKGTLILGLIQGTLGGITLWIFGFNASAMWGMVMVVLSILPMLGSYLVLLPAAAFEIIMGRYLNGLGIALISIIIISNIDNLLRPRLVGRDAGMHDLMVFFSTLGGIYLFGIMGFIVGPVIAALMITLLDIYGIEFNKYIRADKKYAKSSRVLSALARVTQKIKRTKSTEP